MRSQFRALPVLVFLSTLAACGGGGSTSSTPPLSNPPKATATPQPTATPSATPAPTTSAPAAVAQWNSGDSFAPAAVTVSLPSAPAAGDVLIVALWNNGQSDGSAETYTAPAGWNLVDENTGTAYATYQLYSHVVGTGESNLYDFTPQGADRENLWIAADVANASTTAPVDQFANAFINNGTLYTTAAVTPSHGNDLAIAFNLPITSSALTWTNDGSWTVGAGPTAVWNGEALTQVLSAQSAVSQTATLSAAAYGFSAIALLSPAGP